jgi:hypothetical protein
VRAAEPGFRLALAGVQGARRRCKPAQKQRSVYVSERYLLWCPPRYEIPLLNILLGIPLTKRDITLILIEYLVLIVVLRITILEAL